MVGGAEGALGCFSGVCSRAALTLGDLRVIFCLPAFLARSLGVVALAFSATAGLVFGATWLLVRALSAVIRSRLSFPFALSFPAGAAVWLGAGGEVGASEGMVAVVFPEWVLCHSRECLSGANES